MTTSAIIDKIITYTIGGLIAIVGFFATRNLTNMEHALYELNCDVIQLRLDITKLQSTLITEERVKEIVDYQLKLKGL